MSYTPTVWNKGDVITAQKLNKMENAIHAIFPDYIQTNWVDGEIISAEKLNKLEDAIAYVNLDYIKTVWENNDIITASLLNNMENGIEVASVDKTWEEMNWKDIIIATRTGKYQTFTIGAMKELDIGSEGIIQMQIVGIDADVLADESGTAPLTFIGRELLNTNHRMNPTLTPDSAPYDEGTGSIGGWDKTEMKQYILDTVVPKITDVIRNNIKPVKKFTRIFNSDDSAVNDVELHETFWLASRREIFGAVTNAETMGPIYSEVFHDGSSRVKMKVGSQSATAWWLRTASYSGSFTTVNVNGNMDGNYSRTNYGVALGFCL